MKFDIYIHHDHHLMEKVREIMATLDEVLALVTAETTQLDSVIALIDGLKKQLDDVLGGALPPALQAKVDEIFAAATTNAAKVVDALDTNVPPTP